MTVELVDIDILCHNMAQYIRHFSHINCSIQNMWYDDISVEPHKFNIIWLNIPNTVEYSFGPSVLRQSHNALTVNISYGNHTKSMMFPVGRIEDITIIVSLLAAFVAKNKTMFYVNDDVSKIIIEIVELTVILEEICISSDIELLCVIMDDMYSNNKVNRIYDIIEYFSDIGTRHYRPDICAVVLNKMNELGLCNQNPDLTGLDEQLRL